MAGLGYRKATSPDTPWRRWLPLLLAVVFGLVVWEGASRLMNAAIILPGPGETLVRLVTLLLTATFWLSALWTTIRTLIAFGVSLLLALPLGLFMGYSRFAERFFALYLAILRSSPVISVILIAMLWFPGDFVPIFVSLLMVVPLLTGAVTQGVKHQDVRLLEMVKVYQWPLATRIRHLALPTCKPFLLSSSHFALGTAWKACAAAEVLSQPAFGLGSRMQDARLYLDMAAVFALTVTVILLSLLGDIVLRLAFGSDSQADSPTGVGSTRQPGTGIPGEPL